jgi:hypothetical protein
MDNFACALTIGKAHGWETFQNVRQDLAITSASAPYFGNAPTLGLYPTCNCILQQNGIQQLCLLGSPEQQIQKNFQRVRVSH